MGVPPPHHLLRLPCLLLHSGAAPKHQYHPDLPAPQDSPLTIKYLHRLNSVCKVLSNLDWRRL